MIVANGRNRVLTEYNILGGCVVGNAEINLFGTSGCNGKACGTSISNNSVGNVVYDEIKVNISDVYFGVKFVGYLMNDIYIYANNFAVIVKFKWGKECVCFYDIIVGFYAADKKESADDGDSDNKKCNDGGEWDGYAMSTSVRFFSHNLIISQ